MHRGGKTGWGLSLVVVVCSQQLGVCVVHQVLGQGGQGGSSLTARVGPAAASPQLVRPAEAPIYCPSRPPPHPVCAVCSIGAEHIDPSKVSQVWLAQTDQHAYTERPDMNHIVAGTLFKQHAHW